MIYPDIGFTEEYQNLFKDTAFGGEPCHVTFAGIDYRFYKRPIEGTPYFDIVSPYGYSGPVVLTDWGGSGFAQKQEYLARFQIWCNDNMIVAEFARLHPWVNQFVIDERVQSGEVYYVDLTKTEEELWGGLDKGCRSAVKNARKGVELRDADALEIMPLYQETMMRHEAQEYLFDKAFFEKADPLANGIMDTDSTCGALLLKYGDYCHYWLAGGKRKANIGNLIIWQSILWAKSQGCKIFNLGGGVHGNDSLASFKRSFSRLSKPFFTYRRVHNQSVYNELCQAKGVDGSDITGFFPAFRR